MRGLFATVRPTVFSSRIDRRPRKSRMSCYTINSTEEYLCSVWVFELNHALRFNILLQLQKLLQSEAQIPSLGNIKYKFHFDFRFEIDNPKETIRKEILRKKNSVEKNITSQKVTSHQKLLYMHLIN